MSRRRFVRGLSAAAASAALGLAASEDVHAAGRRPNIVYVFADQMRAQAAGFMGNKQVRTPNLDRLAAQGIVFENTVSTCPVCTPYRAALLTGRYPLTTGMVLNDAPLPTTEVTIAKVLKRAGYRTGYVGKWHLDGPRRGGFTPPGPRRQGFDDFWAVANCTHNYMHSFYFRDEPKPIWIKGYDADHQTELAIQFIKESATRQPFCLFLSWGPPHGPYNLMPEEYKIYKPEEIQLRPNCTKPRRQDIAGYYSHIAALDRNFGRIMATLDELGIAQDTILVFTSDHGDMLGSHGMFKKQKPWEESLMVPFVLRYPRAVPAGRRTTALLSSVDIMPTLLGLAGVEIPDTVQGRDLSHIARGADGPRPSSAFLQHACPFIEPIPEWRGVRTERYTYVRTLAGPWLLYDNEADPYQLRNLVGDPAHKELQQQLDDELNRWLDKLDDDFKPREVYWKRFGYTVNERKEIPYTTKVEGA